VDHASPRPEYDAAHDERDGQPPLKRWLLLGLALIGAIGFAGLGVWQVERRAWKLDLIARTEARLRVPPAPMPSPAEWPQLDERDAYIRLRATGRFDHRAETLVKAVTVRGSGFWVLTPLRTAQGIVLVNRGFVPDDLRDPIGRIAGQVAGPVRITGLLRITEPGGGFLRHNDPGHDLWYSRDVATIAAARHLGPVAPFFLDADDAPNPGGYPAGGLTVLRFRNAHLVYALTWFGLMGLCLAMAVLLLRRPRPQE
jgi:surfeit locus 1 family protein